MDSTLGVLQAHQGCWGHTDSYRSGGHSNLIHIVDRRAAWLRLAGNASWGWHLKAYRIEDGHSRQGMIEAWLSEARDFFQRRLAWGRARRVSLPHI